MRLDLGAGGHRLPGFTTVDRAIGSEVYPLPYGNGEADEIRASHILEHFSHREVASVVADWVRVLKPGGLLRIAVPDFQTIAEQYLAGANLPIEGYLMGGHVDDNDRHGALFDRGSLTGLLSNAGLLSICDWVSEIEDCASLPISLNLQGWKPPETWPKTVAVMSVPRLGFMDNITCAERALRPLGIGVRHVQGAFWGQCLTRGIEAAMADGAEYILTIDYDSVYTKQDVENLISAAERYDADAVAPIQSHRKQSRAMFTVEMDGKVQTDMDRAAFNAELVPVESAHFGLTLLRVSAFEDLAKPWFYARPDSEGGWDDGHVDDDVAFWRGWRAAGRSLYLASRVAIGHAELVVRWPDQNLGVLHQHPSDFFEDGKPDGVWK